LKISFRDSFEAKWYHFLSFDQRKGSESALDLLDKLLCFDHEERITASQALAHPYFNNPKKRWYMLQMQQRYQLKTTELSGLQKFPV
jgi:serine/threonine protein kinase